MRDLGVIFDGELGMDAHAGNVVLTCFYQLWQLRSVPRSWTLDAWCTLAVAFISSWVDYCNISSQIIFRLQMLLNAAAHLIVGAGKFGHISPVILDVLHWLLLAQRILLKMTLTAFYSIPGTGLAYFKDVCILVSDISGCLNLCSPGRGDVHFANKNSAQPTEFLSCSITRLEQCLWTCALRPSVMDN